MHDSDVSSDVPINHRSVPRPTVACSRVLSTIPRKLKAWYDSEAVRFFFFREENPVHRVAGAIGLGEAVALISAVGIGSMVLARFGLEIVGYYSFAGGILFLTALAFGTLELAHYVFDRPEF
ncbi:MAG: hypothetical protein WCD81_06795 [Candidatus Bathyarchaeia archaeon]